MAEVLLIYASMSGNTEEMADLIETGLIENGVSVEKLDIMNYNGSNFDQYAAIVLGAYTWGDGELPDDFEDLYEEMDDIDLTGKAFAIFGSGDTAYEHFCAAVDILEEKVKEKGGNLIADGLKVELNPAGEDRDRCIAFALQIASSLK